MRLDSALQNYMNNDLKKTSQPSRRISQASKDSSKSSNSSSIKGMNSGKDRVEISPESQDRIARIKARVSSGYYQGEQIDEDISEKLSRYFEEVTRDL